MVFLQCLDICSVEAVLCFILLLDIYFRWVFLTDVLTTVRPFLKGLLVTLYKQHLLLLLLLLLFEPIIEVSTPQSCILNVLNLVETDRKQVYLIPCGVIRESSLWVYQEKILTDVVFLEDKDI